LIVLGIDPSLNNTGYCAFDDSGRVTDMGVHKFDHAAPPQVKIKTQRSCLRALIRATNPTHIGIEQPYVQGAGRFGGGGDQTANMWAVYMVFMMEFMDRNLPVVMFNVTTLKSLIIRKRGLKKKEIVAEAKKQLEADGDLGELKLNEHEADAYFVARNARDFWLWVKEDKPPRSGHQLDIFSSQKIGSSGKPRGIYQRPGEFFIDPSQHGMNG